MDNEILKLIKENSFNNSVSLTDEDFDPRFLIMDYYESVFDARQDMLLWLASISQKYSSFSTGNYLSSIPVKAMSGFANRPTDHMDHLEAFIKSGITFNHFIISVTLTPLNS